MSEVPLYAPGEGGGSAPARRGLNVIQASPSLSTWAHQFGEPGRVPAPKLTGVYRTPSVPTWEWSVNPMEWCQGFEITP